MRVSKIVVAVLGIGVCATSSVAGEREKRLANTVLESVLASEVGGVAIDRRAALSHVGELGDAIRWHSGQIEVDGNWYRIEELSNRKPSQATKAYVARRGKARPALEDHRNLARWCELNSLPESASAHWYSVLLRHPDDLEARRALQHKWIAGAWYSIHDLQSSTERRLRLHAEWRKWMPQMKKIAKGLMHSDSHRQQAALEALASIDDPSVISSLESTCPQMPGYTQPFVKAVAKYRSNEACLAICRIALADVNRNTTAIAVKEIAKYQEEVYVPELLSLLSEPVYTEMQYLVRPNGEMRLQRALFHETTDKRELLTLDRLVRVNGGSRAYSVNGRFGLVHPNGYLSNTPIPVFGSTVPTDILADELAASSNALEDQRQLQHEINLHNQRNAETSSRVAGLLTRLTGQTFERPTEWWDWWSRYNYRSQSRKPLKEYHYEYGDRPRYGVIAAKTGSTRQHSCLVPGTLIQTNFGLRPIESLCVGDVVVAQDVESGKLDQKVILETTLREPTDITRIQTEGEDILATLGHRWFVPGKGWLMTAELAIDMQMHTATGTVTIAGIEPQEEQQPTHNLVVEDSHTYFVGQSRILSYDNTSATPTLRSVPGFGTVGK